MPNKELQVTDRSVPVMNVVEQVKTAALSVLQNQSLTSEDTAAIAKLPPDELRAKLVEMVLGDNEQNDEEIQEGIRDYFTNNKWVHDVIQVMYAFDHADGQFLYVHNSEDPSHTNRVKEVATELGANDTRVMTISIPKDLSVSERSVLVNELAAQDKLGVRVFVYTQREHLPYESLIIQLELDSPLTPDFAGRAVSVTGDRVQNNYEDPRGFAKAADIGPHCGSRTRIDASHGFSESAAGERGHGGELKGAIRGAWSIVPPPGSKIPYTEQQRNSLMQYGLNTHYRKGDKVIRQSERTCIEGDTVYRDASRTRLHQLTQETFRATNQAILMQGTASKANVEEAMAVLNSFLDVLIAAGVLNVGSRAFAEYETDSAALRMKVVFSPTPLIDCIITEWFEQVYQISE